MEKNLGRGPVLGGNITQTERMIYDLYNAESPSSEQVLIFVFETSMGREEAVAVARCNDAVALRLLGGSHVEIWYDAC